MISRSSNHTKYNPKLLEGLNFSALLLAFALTLLMLYKVIFLANVGIDLTDEGYYLNWISNPWLYKYYVSQFGYIYHPIYQLLGGDFVLLRVFNALFTYGLGLILTYMIVRRLSNHQSQFNLFVMSASIALPSLFILMITGHWVPTPSYNSLCFQGLLVTIIGIVLSDSNEKYRQFQSACLIGVGGWLVFMAKPSSALLLAVVVPVYFAFEIKKYWRLLLIAGLTAICMLLISAIYIDGNLLQYIKRYQMGLHLISVMGSKHGLDNLLRLDLFKVSVADQYKFLFFTGFMTSVFLSIQRGSQKTKQIMLGAIFIAMAVMLWYTFLRNGIKIHTPRYHPLILLAPLFAAILSWLFGGRLSESTKLPKKLILVLLVLPYVYAAGTGNNYWETAAGTMIFWVIASLLILERSIPGHTKLVVLAVVVASTTVKVLFDAQNSPYRQTEAIAQQASVYINPHTKKELLLPKDSSAYLRDLNLLLEKTGFKKNTPVIDFTGHHPGTLYFMQAKAIGQAWTIGGYDGSNDMATFALNQATCHEIANAWLIIEKDGRRKVDYHILEKHGIQADKDNYTKVGMILTKVLTDPGFANQHYPHGRYEQYFLKPTHPETQEKKCLASRQQDFNTRH